MEGGIELSKYDDADRLRAVTFVVGSNMARTESLKNRRRDSTLA